MKEGNLILGKNLSYSMDCYKTRVNNNVLVVGASGAGKTRGIVEPNILEATGSYIISDPKGNLYNKYKNYLEDKGYRVLKLDFTDPKHSEHYNFFDYIRSTQDIVKIAHMLIYSQGISREDPFWDLSSQLLMQSLISLLVEKAPDDEMNFGVLMEMLGGCEASDDNESFKCGMDLMMEDIGKADPNSYAYKTYRKYRVGAGKTLKSILITANAKLGLYDTPDLNEMMKDDTIHIQTIGIRKTALFVCVSDTDRSLDGLINIFFTQAINELVHFADKRCRNNCLPIPTRFILDDFATNVVIGDFPRMISSIRSRGISTMLMLQAESQLMATYGYNWRTIIGNCDNYVYMGGNDVETARAISERCDIPLKQILNMPIGTNWVFRRGQLPIRGVNYEPDDRILEKYRKSRNGFDDDFDLLL